MKDLPLVSCFSGIKLLPSLMPSVLKTIVQHILSGFFWVVALGRRVNPIFVTPSLSEAPIHF